MDLRSGSRPKGEMEGSVNTGPIGKEAAEGEDAELHQHLSAPKAGRHGLDY